MIEKDLFDVLQAMLPAEVQYINPYIDDAPVPKGNYCQFNIIDRSNIGWNQDRYVSENNVKKTVTYAHDIQRIYTVQIDFYGKDAFDLAGQYNQILMQSLIDDDNWQVDLKKIGTVENRCFLPENKKYQRRYGFDVELFVIDTITDETPYIENIITSTRRI